ncbi:MAG: Hsp70 family protein [Spirochaetes bacterium]|nr:Hsp70 family protein [Spirochaetota bacterium]
MSVPKSIGIKLYDGSFVPVLTDEESKIKKVTLTTIKDNQDKAVIELYEGTSEKCVNNEYLGKLTIDLNRETQKGDPAFEVHLRLDEDGMLYAKAWDIDTQEETEIKIEHSKAPTATHRIFPENQSDEVTHTNDLESEEKIVSYPEEVDYEAMRKNPQGSKRIGIIPIIIILIIVLLLAAGAGFGMYKFLTGRDKKPPVAQQETTQPKEEPVVEEKPEPQPEPVEETVEAKEEVKEEPVVTESKPEPPKEEIKGMKKPEGKPHYVRWGDNLWDICKRYYQDPWYYPSLAEYNNITNPRLIYAGTYVVIPDKSQLTRWDFSH